MFTGGYDVDPTLYGEPIHSTSQCSLERDMKEAVVFQICRDNMIPMVGICRGAQFLTVMAGGKLIQHVGGHLGNHTATIKNVLGVEEEFIVNSTHHQMMYPFNLAASCFKLLGYSEGVGKSFEGFPKIENDLGRFAQRNIHKAIEPELIYYPMLHALAIQFHPETLPSSSEVVRLVKKLIAFHLLRRYNTYDRRD